MPIIDLGRRAWLLLPLALALQYVVLVGSDNDATVPQAWPVTGIVTALLLVTARAYRSGVVTVFAVASGGVYYAAGLPGDIALGFAVGAALEVAVTVIGLDQINNGRPSLRDQRGLGALLASAFCGALINAAVVASVSQSFDYGDPLLLGAVVLVSHTVSQLLFVSLVVPAPSNVSRSGSQEQLAQTAVVLGVIAVSSLIPDQPVLILTAYPIMVWLAVRNTFRTALVTLIALYVAISASVMLGIGPTSGNVALVSATPDELTLATQMLLASLVLITLPAAVIVAVLRRTADQAAADNLTMTQLIRATTGIAIVATDRQGTIVRFNPGAERLLGYSESEVMGRSPEMFYTVGEIRRLAKALGVKENLPAILSAMGEKPEGDVMTWEHVRQDGDARLFSVTVTPTRDEEGRPTGHLLTAEDITEQVATEAALRTALEHEKHATDRLSQIDVMKNELVSTVSHELRTPIANIQGYTEVLIDGGAGPVTDNQADWLNRIDRNSKRLMLLVDNLLTISRVEDTQMQIEPGLVQVDDLVSEVVDQLQPTLANRSLTFLVRRTTADLRMSGDPEQIRRALANLLTNAIKFTPDGGRVSLDVSGDDQSVTFTVVDTGIGMTDEEQSQLFTRFFRSSSAYERQIPGTGLGLYITQQIVERHGGSICATSQPGHGSTFTATLPREPGTTLVTAERD